MQKKVSDDIQHFFTRLQKKKKNIKYRRTYLNTTKALYEKPTANIIIVEKQNFLSKIWNKTTLVKVAIIKGKKIWLVRMDTEKLESLLYIVGGNVKWVSCYGK